MGMWEWTVLAIALVVYYVAQPPRNECFRGRGEILRNLATKTPYSFVANLDDSEVVSDGCEVSQVWMVIRHGTRCPNKKGIGFLNERLPDIARSLDMTKFCPDFVRDLTEWIPEAMQQSDEKNLHAEGESELFQMGQRVRSRFPSLFSGYNEESATFRSTDTHRSRLSMKSFAKGLFGPSAKVKFDPEIKPHDSVIRFYKLCDRWQHRVKLQPVVEQVKFEESELFQSEVREDLSRKLGFNLTLDDLDGLYVGCTFGQAWNPTVPAPWCQLFSERQLKIMEFREDVDYFYTDGPGNYELNSQPACVLTKDVIERFLDPTSTRGTFYFTHSGTILKFLTHLGVYDASETLTHEGFEDWSEEFSTSKTDPFGSNVAFVLQKCGETRRIGVFVNEAQRSIKGCEGEAWCDFDEFLRVHSKTVRNCDLSQMCSLSPEEQLKFSRGQISDDRF